MYSDTHFHFHYISENSEDSAIEVLEEMANNRIFFGMDIGTRCDDLLYRKNILEDSISNLDDMRRKRLEKSIFFSAGIWPDVDSINNRFECIKTLEEQIEEFKDDDSIFSDHLVAIGEGGLDHHWNPSGTDGRCAEDFNRAVFEGEKELFEMQLELARKMNLPFIVHSRDAYIETLDSIKNVGYHNGIIHCYSYGKDEVKCFLDKGWYISLSGAVTYAKKAKMDEMESLINYIPDDRLLLETDSPYLAPVPMRGQDNNPTFIKYTYDFVASKKNIRIEKLCDIVDKNCKTLFKI